MRTCYIHMYTHICIQYILDIFIALLSFLNSFLLSFNSFPTGFPPTIIFLFLFADPLSFSKSCLPELEGRMFLLGYGLVTSGCITEGLKQPSHPIHDGMLKDPSSACLTSVATAIVSLSILIMSHPEDRISYYSYLVWHLAFFLLFFSWEEIQILIRTSLTLHFDQLLVSILVVSYYKQLVLFCAFLNPKPWGSITHI